LSLLVFGKWRISEIITPNNGNRFLAAFQFLSIIGHFNG
jgi:hypothetical protein